MKRAITLLITAIVILSGAITALASNQEPQPVPLFPAQQEMNWGVYLRSHLVNVVINNQVATTRIEQVFVNETNSLAEGTYIFPLPRGAVVTDLVMFVDGKAISAKILDADQAKSIYEETVRRMRDPALLEYIGQDAIQASVFPIQPHDDVKIELEYSHVVPVENGLVHYEYPLRTDQFSRLPVSTLAINIQVTSNDPISSVYSPTHRIAINRQGDYGFNAGYEMSNAREKSNFSLYYGLASETIDVNLLTYRESATEDGFFLLLIAPPVEANTVKVMPKDVIVVLDQSGSMFGEKWDQAREAAKYVLDNLNAEDRFNVVAFSTGWRVYSRNLEAPGEAKGAQQWLDGLEAVGGTDIDGALTTAYGMADPDRQTVVLFLTDGLPTEGETDVADILENSEANAPKNARLFTFGVGDDVDTFLLDQLHAQLNGAGAYVRSNERIDEEVSTLYNKISSPVMTDINLDFGDILAEDYYPGDPLPDLFLGSQLIVAGRFRGDGTTTLTLNGKVNGEEVSVKYESLEFPARAGGEASIPRLWATRKIGSMLNAIRLNGENPELVDSIVRLSTRYGIITPYTSFLIEEEDIFSQEGRDRVSNQMSTDMGTMSQSTTGGAAVDAADSAAKMEEAESAPVYAMPDTGGGGGSAVPGAPAPTQTGEYTMGYRGAEPMQVVEDRTFVLRDGTTWIDTTYDSSAMEPTKIVFLSDEYFDLLEAHPEISVYLAIGDHIILVIEGDAYEIVPE